MLFHRVNGVGDAFDLADGTDTDVLTRLGGKPALIHLPGAEQRPYRMISVLLHGNEDSGFRGLVAWLRDRPEPANPMWLFIGNTRAASQEGWFADRFLDDQEDFNRVWGIRPVSTRMRRCAAEVLEIVTAAPLEAVIDLHNNTGDNPFYAIMPTTTEETGALAGMVADIGLIWGTQQHTLMQALESYCPAVAVECGRMGVPAHAQDARRVIERFVSMPKVEAGMPRPAQTFQVMFRVEVRPEVAFDFAAELDEDEVDFAIQPGLDRDNFGMLLAGTRIGQILPGSELPLLVTDVRGEDVSGRFFSVGSDGTISTSEDITPAMMTRTPAQTRRDCLFYIVRLRA